jgi:hypothetical protein
MGKSKLFKDDFVVEIIFCLLSDYHFIQNINNKDTPLHLYNPVFKELTNLAIVDQNRMIKFKLFNISNTLIVVDFKQENYKVYKLYNNLFFNHTKNIISEIDEAISALISETNNKEKRKLKRKQQDWLNDIKTHIEQGNRNKQRLYLAIKRNLPTKQPSRLINRIIIKNIDTISQNKTKKVYEKSTIVSQLMKMKR